MTANLDERAEHLRELSSRMLADADACNHFPLQQKLLEAAAELLRKAEEIGKLASNR